MDKAKIRKAVRDLLEAIGEDPDREGLADTPRRVADMYEEVFSGLHRADEELKNIVVTFHADFDEDEMVIVKDIPFYSMCEHHLLPFFGKAHVAYIPKENRVTGLSKIARAVDLISRAPQLQERLTTKIADTIMNLVNPLGVFVIVEAEHLCMIMRGIKKPGSKTVTSAMRGAFKRKSTREEALFLIKGGH
ncbi:MAG TPA: GTP cyclohydrolase I FolE [Candidatus Mcinerneyibacteriales bacterium]|nr:GTP cyclohydrolase I FolE [Candidatus Mcinerneyibacteriales bacterium]HPE20352.1 GTP cyclohydrolase I FolE [Candidatus Mcinerneyibacteriales bacterium]HPJ69483.1 GTP cyclohydrolase I FolE [Candidatus Mcinerneyibacteriales bacterium]HPQ88486.1 GTP cyclohydrolase I FolE [Candidatus Mcinerneyibacteriales bacterium]